jgi:hypothetical protein
MPMLRLFLVGLVGLAPSFHEGELFITLPSTVGQPEEHFPVLVYDTKRNGGEPNDWSEIAYKLGVVGDPRQKPGGILLKGELIEIRKGVKEGSLDFVLNRRQRRWYDWIGAFPKNRYEATDFSWVPFMDSFSLRSASLRKPSEIQEKVAAVMEIEKVKGCVTTFSLAQRGEKVPSLTFRKPGTPCLPWTFRQAVADVVLVSMELKDSQVTILIGGRRLKLKSESGKDIDVLLGNLTRMPASCEEERMSEAKHFSHYYDLALDIGAKEDVKIPVVGLFGIAAEKVQPTSCDIPFVMSFVGSGQRRAGKCVEKGKGGYNRAICGVLSYNS